MVAQHCLMWMDWVQVCVHLQKLIFTQFWNPEIWNQGQGQSPFGRPPGRLLPGSWLLVTAGVTWLVVSWCQSASVSPSLCTYKVSHVLQGHSSESRPSQVIQDDFTLRSFTWLPYSRILFPKSHNHRFWGIRTWTYLFNLLYWLLQIMPKE